MTAERKPLHAHAEARALLTRLLHDPAIVRTLSNDELDLTLRVARRARVLGTVAAQLEQAASPSELPDIVADQLTSAKVLAEARTRAALWELDRLASALAGAPPARLVVLKGCAYALSGLPNSAGRSFADLDLLIGKEDLEGVESRLVERGWAFTKLSHYDQHYYRAWTHELPPLVHRERATEVDLHHSILPQTARLTPDPALLLDAARRIPGTPYSRLSDEDLVLHAMTHLCFDSDMADALRDLVDIHVLLEHFSGVDPEFWPRLLERARRLDLARPAFYGLRLAKRLLGTPVPDAVLRASEPGAPPRIVVRLMDFLAPRALFPQHPDRPSAVAGAARLCLYLRSHWIRMPPLLLARHLSYKFYVAHLKTMFSSSWLGGRLRRSREA